MRFTIVFEGEQTISFVVVGTLQNAKTKATRTMSPGYSAIKILDMNNKIVTSRIYNNNEWSDWLCC